MSTELFGVAYLFIGVALIVWGARLAQLMIGLWGLGVGLWLGEIITYNHHFTYSWTFLAIWGLGIAGMVLAYSFYQLALSVLVGFTTYWIAVGFLNLTSLTAGMSELLGIVAGLLIGLYAIRGLLSYLILMIVTSIVGAAYTICGVLILIDGANESHLGFGPLNFVLDQTNVWLVSMILLIVVGLIVQDNPRERRLSSNAI